MSVTSEHGHIQLTCDLSNSEGTIKRVFQTKNDCCSRSGDIKKGFLLDCTENVKLCEMWKKKFLNYVKV